MQVIKEGKVKGTTKVCKYCNAKFIFYKADVKMRCAFGRHLVLVKCPCCGEEIVVHEEKF